MGAHPGVERKADSHCPWPTSTLRHAAESFARFSLRQARMVKSPWSISLRQKRCTSGAQAFSSCSEPLCARALVEIGTDSRMSAKKNLCIMIVPLDFHHSNGHGVGNAVHSITIAWSLSPEVGALRSSRTRGMAASERIIINLKSSM
jgi:hypothetical protein